MTKLLLLKETRKMEMDKSYEKAFRYMDRDYQSSFPEPSRMSEYANSLYRGLEIEMHINEQITLFDVIQRWICIAQSVTQGRRDIEEEQSQEVFFQKTKKRLLDLVKRGGRNRRGGKKKRGRRGGRMHRPRRAERTEARTWEHATAFARMPSEVQNEIIGYDPK